MYGTLVSIYGTHTVVIRDALSCCAFNHSGILLPNLPKPRPS